MCGKNEHVLDYLEDAVVGSTIQFHYEGGSNPGIRTVEVTSVDKDSETIVGHCKERDNQFRTFKSNLASDIKVLKHAGEVAQPVNGNELRVRFDEAGEKLLASLPADKLAELYSQYVAVQENDGVTFDEDSGEVVVKLVDRTPKIATYYGDFNPTVLVFKRGNKEFRIHNYTSGDFGVHNDVTNFDNSSVTDPNVLLRELQAFLA